MNANDFLSQYRCTDHYYQFNSSVLITDGAKAMADEFQCYWFLDIIASYQQVLKDEEFQIWKLTRMDDTSAADVVCTDGNHKVLIEQRINFTDFKPSEATLWVEGDVILLPSEH